MTVGAVGYHECIFHTMCVCLVVCTAMECVGGGPSLHGGLVIGIVAGSDPGSASSIFAWTCVQCVWALFGLVPWYKDIMTFNLY